MDLLASAAFFLEDEVKPVLNDKERLNNKRIRAGNDLTSSSSKGSSPSNKSLKIDNKAFEKTPGIKKWYHHEQFYSSLDYEYFQVENEFISCLKHLGLDHIQFLNRDGWTQVRSLIGSKIGKPRRLSRSFLKNERIKLEGYRRTVRHMHSVCSFIDRKAFSKDVQIVANEIGIHFPYTVYSSIIVGDRVTVCNSANSTMIHGNVKEIINSNSSNSSSDSKIYSILKDNNNGDDKDKDIEEEEEDGESSNKEINNIINVKDTDIKIDTTLHKSNILFSNERDQDLNQQLTTTTNTEYISTRYQLESDNIIDNNETDNVVAEEKDLLECFEIINLVWSFCYSEAKKFAESHLKSKLKSNNSNNNSSNNNSSSSIIENNSIISNNHKPSSVISILNDTNENVTSSNLIIRCLACIFILRDPRKWEGKKANVVMEALSMKVCNDNMKDFPYVAKLMAGIINTLHES
jgi:hypothetical protein